ncbi:MAG: hypothetical protein PVF68_16285 [Acidobacteriota bacterium]|jgi:hypothetical protein
MRRGLGWLLLALAAGSPPAPGDLPSPRLPEITVEVVEDAWRVGDEKTYTLTFDRAPFGRQAMRLVSVRDLPDGDREAVFRQRIRLDLRAIGQPGSLEQAGTLTYRRSGPGPYRYEEVILDDREYDTYRGPGDYAADRNAAIDPGAGTYRVGRDPGSEETHALPEPTGAIVVDLLVVGHWEPVFAARKRWPLGSHWTLPLLLPTDPPRFDFHREVREPREVHPRRVDAELTIESKETIDLLGARLEAFRCRVEPFGITLWVSPHGGVLRFADGRGLVGSLEP